MQVLTEKNSLLSKELEECKAQLEAALIPRRPPLVIYTSKDKYFAKHGIGANLTNEIADGAGLNPERKHLLHQLKTGEKVLTKVRREKNDLQDANTKMGVELKDVRAQLSDSVKENQRLRRGIFSKCLNEPLKESSAGKSTNKAMSVGVLIGHPIEEMPGSTGDLLPELSQLLDQVRQTMQGVA